MADKSSENKNKLKRIIFYILSIIFYIFSPIIFKKNILVGLDFYFDVIIPTFFVIFFIMISLILYKFSKNDDEIYIKQSLRTIILYFDILLFLLLSFNIALNVINNFFNIFNEDSKCIENLLYVFCLICFIIFNKMVYDCLVNKQVKKNKIKDAILTDSEIINYTDNIYDDIYRFKEEFNLMNLKELEKRKISNELKIAKIEFEIKQKEQGILNSKAVMLPTFVAISLAFAGHPLFVTILLYIALVILDIFFSKEEKEYNEYWKVKIKTKMILEKEIELIDEKIEELNK